MPFGEGSGPFGESAGLSRRGVLFRYSDLLQRFGQELPNGRVMYRVGLHEAVRRSVERDHVEDFLSEFMMGCFLSPDPDHVALTCACGANRARTFLLMERRERSRVWHGEVSSALLLSESASVLVSLRDGGLRPAQVALCQELHRRLGGAMSQLTARQRRVLHLRYYECLPLGEVAVRTHQSYGAVRAMVHTGHRQLQRILEGEDLGLGEALDYLSRIGRQTQR